MTNIEGSVICHPPIPLAHITPLETLVLTNALECREIEAILVPFTDFGAMHPIRVRRHELNEAFRASAPHVDSALNIFIASRIIPHHCPSARPVRRRRYGSVSRHRLERIPVAVRGAGAPWRDH
ncbi:hypothetical protein [Sinorhizobium meliloti]|uniref:Uncharacterized protein n=1 Tax=Sinorhizobium meliloti (strain SM11) TaxID=707241 RepID=F7XF03_SINMM|nr:hypothetical protein [Sinorhizobium meliloti]AEH82128.1 hypothetical protein SM11_pC1055 [Sinorhizobium meliloti SM11]MDE3763328.1 hypothetical protein [Sinorhizobium meliloti]MDE3788567.1 hypothetical protein [Sinorhizobium meliloti]MDE3805636.1 hypothetical protein [Sinorhizobium meliloti]MDE4551303.1 hypothetical protein [Sinorhizobium meliloti]